MCFAVPLQVDRATKTHAVMEDGRKVKTAMVGAAKKGDWLLVQSNLAVDRLTEENASAMRTAIQEVAHDI